MRWIGSFQTFKFDTADGLLSADQYADAGFSPHYNADVFWVRADARTTNVTAIPDVLTRTKVNIVGETAYNIFEENDVIFRDEILISEIPTRGEPVKRGRQDRDRVSD